MAGHGENKTQKVSRDWTTEYRILSCMGLRQPVQYFSLLYSCCNCLEKWSLKANVLKSYGLGIIMKSPWVVGTVSLKGIMEKILVFSSSWLMTGFALPGTPAMLGHITPSPKQ